MKKYNRTTALSVFALLLTALAGFSQSAKTQYTIGLANVKSTSTTLEMDVTLTIEGAQKGSKLSQLTVGINFDPSILDDGKPCTDKNCGSWAYIGGKSEALSKLSATSNTVKSDYGHLRIVGMPLQYDAAISLPDGTYTLGRYRLTNSKSFAANADARLWIQPNNEGNNSNSIVSVFPTEKSRKLNAYSASKNGQTVFLEYTDDNPLHVTVNAKADATAGFTVVAYPNPYMESFALNVTGEGDLDIKVYDMLGKLIENRTVVAAEAEQTKMGVNYPSGIYNLNVTQGNNTQTLRIIKR